MPDETAVETDKAQAPDETGKTATAGNETAPAKKEEVQDTPKKFLGYESEDEAEKGIRELRSFATKASQENAELRRRLESIEQSSKSKSNEESERQHEQRMTAVAKHIASLARNAEDPQEVLATEMLKVQRGMALDMADLVERKVQQELAKLSSRIEENDPDYRANRKEIDRLMEDYGIDRTAAKKLYEKELKPKTGLVAPKVEKPGGLRKTAVSESDDDGELPELDSYTKSRLKAFGLSPEDEKAVIQNTRKALKKG